MRMMRIEIPVCDDVDDSTVLEAAQELAKELYLDDEDDDTLGMTEDELEAAVSVQILTTEST